MPAVSESQRRLFGMVHAAQKGKLKNPPGKVQDMADKISPTSVGHFAGTKHKDIKKHHEKKAGPLMGLAAGIEDVGRAAAPHLAAGARGVADFVAPKAKALGQFAEHWQQAANVRSLMPELTNEAKSMGSQFRGFRPVGDGSVTSTFGGKPNGNAALANMLVSHGITPGRTALAAGATGLASLGAANTDKQGAAVIKQAFNMAEIATQLGRAAANKTQSFLEGGGGDAALARLKQVGQTAGRGAMEGAGRGAVIGGGIGAAGGGVGGAANPGGQSRLGAGLQGAGEGALLGGIGGGLVGGVHGGIKGMHDTVHFNSPTEPAASAPLAHINQADSLGLRRPGDSPRPQPSMPKPSGIRPEDTIGLRHSTNVPGPQLGGGSVLGGGNLSPALQAILERAQKRGGDLNSGIVKSAMAKLAAMTKRAELRRTVDRLVKAAAWRKLALAMPNPAADKAMAGMVRLGGVPRIGGGPMGTGTGKGFNIAGTGGGGPLSKQLQNFKMPSGPPLMSSQNTLA